jgi:hypothetical protein
LDTALATTLSESVVLNAKHNFEIVHSIGKVKLVVEIFI